MNHSRSQLGHSNLLVIESFDILPNQLANCVIGWGIGSTQESFCLATHKLRNILVGHLYSAKASPVQFVIILYAFYTHHCLSCRSSTATPILNKFKGLNYGTQSPLNKPKERISTSIIQRAPPIITVFV